MRAFSQQQMHLSKGVKDWESVGNDGCIVVLFGEPRADMQEVVERLDELRTAVGGPQPGNSFAVQAESVMMVVLVDAADNRQPMLLVLNDAPQEIVQWT